MDKTQENSLNWNRGAAEEKPAPVKEASTPKKAPAKKTTKKT